MRESNKEVDESTTIVANLTHRTPRQKTSKEVDQQNLIGIYRAICIEP